MISVLSRIKVFIASFFIQASWSFEKMQSLGFAAAISPALDEIYGDAGKKKTALLRHLAFYNAHPYMASPVLGAAINMEERASRGACSQEASANFKKMIMGPYGAIGDQFFWGSVRPLASSIGILASLLWGLWGPLVFLLVYNIFHLWMRWRGLERGLSLGEGVVGYIKGLELPEWGARFKYVSAAVLGSAAAVTVLVLTGLYGLEGDGERILAIPATLFIMGSGMLLAMLFKKGVTVSKLLYAVVLPLVIAGALVF